MASPTAKGPGKGKGTKGKDKEKAKGKGKGKVKGEGKDPSKEAPKKTKAAKKRPAAAGRVAYGETMGGGGETSEPPEPVSKKSKDEKEKEPYNFTPYKTRNIAAIRETFGAKKQVLQVGIGYQNLLA